MTGRGNLQHGLVIRLSEQFQVTGLRRNVPKRNWHRFPSRVAVATANALSLLAAHDTKATFSVDSWIAEHHPDVIDHISKRGHGVEFVDDGASDGLDGAWIRHVPEALWARRLKRWQTLDSPDVLTFDIWQLDEDLPPLTIHTGFDRQRMYRNLDRFLPRLRALLATASFGPTFTPDQKAVKQHRTKAVDQPLAPANGKMGAPVSIVVPCYNEEQTLPYLAQAIIDLLEGFGTRHGLSFILVDDGSTDETWSEMQRLFGEAPQFKLVKHAQNRGIGAAIQTGIQASDDEIVAVMDSDCSYDPARLEDMLPLLEDDVAMVTASPYHEDGGVEGVPEWRLFLSKGASQLYGRVLRNKLATYTSCFRVCRRSAMAEVALRHDGYIGVVEQLARLDLAGWRIVELPVVLESRMLGQSKMKVVNAITDHLKFLAEVSVLRLRNAPTTAANTTSTVANTNDIRSANE